MGRELEAPDHLQHGRLHALGPGPLINLRAGHNGSASGIGGSTGGVFGSSGGEWL
jgi:hypothetical protein